jgi:catechol 2,3-dioxygenase-like lactoylglutathione lyase family enzyme
MMDNLNLSDVLIEGLNQVRKVGMFRKPAAKQHVNPRYRAYGRARIDIAQRADTPGEWERLWKQPQQEFPFAWGRYWKQCIEYKVDDFAAEVGFFIDVLGLPVNAFTPEYAMFTGPGRDFYFAVIPTPEGGTSTPAEAIRLQFMVEDLFATTQELERRGISFEQLPEALTLNSNQWIASFHTPHGICVELWGFVETRSQPEAREDLLQGSKSLSLQTHQPDDENSSGRAIIPSPQPERQTVLKGNGNPVLPTMPRRQPAIEVGDARELQQDEKPGSAVSQPGGRLDLSWKKSRTYSFSDLQGDETPSGAGKDPLPGVINGSARAAGKTGTLPSGIGLSPRLVSQPEEMDQRKGSSGIEAPEPEVESGYHRSHPARHIPKKPLSRTSLIFTQPERAKSTPSQEAETDLDAENELELEEENDEDLDFGYDYEYVDAESFPAQETIRRKEAHGNKPISRLS